MLKGTLILKSGTIPKIDRHNSSVTVYTIVTFPSILRHTNYIHFRLRISYTIIYSAYKTHLHAGIWRKN